MFLQVGSDFINVLHVQTIEYVDGKECEVTFTSGDSVVFEMTAAELMKQIERRLEVG